MCGLNQGKSPLKTVEHVPPLHVPLHPRVQHLVQPLGSPTSPFLTHSIRLHLLLIFTLSTNALAASLPTFVIAFSSFSACGNADCLSVSTHPRLAHRVLVAIRPQGRYALLERYTWPTRDTVWEAAFDTEERRVRVLFTGVRNCTIIGGGERGL